MKMAADDGLCDARTFRRRKVTTRKTRWLTPEEFDRLAAGLEPHIVPIIGFMCVFRGHPAGDSDNIRPPIPI
jgi:hypothetical protein